MNGIFGEFKSSKPAFQALPAGEQTVALVAVQEVDSLHNPDGTEKAEEKRKGWADATPQVLITVIGITNKGGMSHRLNGLGYKRFDELTDKQLSSGKYINVEGYACIKDAKQNIVRIKDDARTEQCKSILNEVFNALQIPEGSGMEALAEAAAERRQMQVNVAADEYDGKTNFKLKKFRKPAVAAPATFE